MGLALLENLLAIDPWESDSSFDNIIRRRLLETHVDNEALNNIFNKNDVILDKCGSSVRWEYVYKILYSLLSHTEVVNLDTMVSVRNEKLFKSSLEFVTSLGVIPSLLPGIGLPLYRRCKHAHLIAVEDIGDTEKYFRLRACIDVFVILWKVECMKKVIFSNFLCDFLASLMQFSFAPLKKQPDGVADITPELWLVLQADRLRYHNVFDTIVITTHQPTIIRQLMLIQSSTSPKPPVFLKKCLSKELSKRLMAKEGLISLIKCFIDDTSFDSGTQWKEIDMIARLVAVDHCEGFIDNLCHQIMKMIDSSDSTYTAVTAACINGVYSSHQSSIVLSLYNYLFGSLRNTVLREGNKHAGILLLSSFEIEHRIEIIHSCFCSPITSSNINLLEDIIYSLFQLFIFSQNVRLKRLLCDLISTFLSKTTSINDCRHNASLDLIFLGLSDNKAKLELYCDFAVSDTGVQIKGSSQSYHHPLELALQGVLSLLNETKIETLPIIVFTYSLETLCYFEDTSVFSEKDLLEFEAEPVNLLDWHSSCRIVLLNLLEELSDSDIVAKSVKNDSTSILSFLIKFLEKATDLKNGIIPSHEECVIISLVLLTSILSESHDKNKVRSICQPLTENFENIEKLTKRPEIKLLVKECLMFLSQSQRSKNIIATKLDSALELLGDPLLPVRAHGLIEIKKLLEEKDPETLSKKHFVLCIFQENLKNDDSYMYLTAINGLASLANICTEDVLEMLTKEYLNAQQKIVTTSSEIQTSTDIRMKIGEVLLKVTKSLGDMLPQYKTLLLNTFLVSCKDSDFLIRASALSNLAEVCRVLSYKLGSIVYEILLCVWSTIEMDKSPECRRAAVMVTSSILKGLGREALSFLKDALLPMYRTLKRLNEDSKEDDVIRLHAQIALEELNDCVKEALFPEFKMEKKIFILD